MKTVIEYVDFGIGNRYEDKDTTIIELNENLKNYPNLHKSILRHELSHTDKSFTLSDIKTDLGEHKVSSFELFKFMLKYPKAFTQFLPFYWTKKYGFVYDINLLLFYGCFIMCIILGIYFSGFF